MAVAPQKRKGYNAELDGIFTPYRLRIWLDVSNSLAGAAVPTYFGLNRTTTLPGERMSLTCESRNPPIFIGLRTLV
jgi:hypothetical protein